MQETTDIGSLVEHINPIPMDLLEITVTVNPDNAVLIEYADALYSEISAELAKTGGREIIGQADIRNYVQWLVIQRVNWVNGDKVQAHPKGRDFFVPSYISVVLAHIGVVLDRDRNIMLKPTLPKGFKIEAGGVEFSKEDAKRISNHLMTWRNAGLEGVEGYEANKDGSFEFMTYCVIEDQVVRYEANAHPTFALLAATVALKGVEATLVPRVKYGSLDTYRNYMGDLARFKQ